MPPSTTEVVSDWWGIIKGNEPGAQFDDCFERQDLGQAISFGIDSMDPAVQAKIEALRDICAVGYRHAIASRSAAETDPPFAVLPRGESCVLCGDFNSPAGAPEHAALLLPGATPELKNAWSLVHGAVPHAGHFIPPAPTFGVHDRRYLAEPACYDFFYVSANIDGLVRDVIVDGATTASDHQPVLLVLSS